ncbi:hypothetical protein TNCV_3560741 [Trichonephila clavipes]|nr:hypothetical protein TNCV_3560741 [Trichonephila clavipes]
MEESKPCGLHQVVWTIPYIWTILSCMYLYGSPPHYHTNVHAYLDNVAPGHWIERRCSIEYLVRSPDLTLLGITSKTWCTARNERDYAMKLKRLVMQFLLLL